jgi:hypothetical protein
VLAQVSIEFISLVSVLFILLILTIYYNSEFYYQIYSTRIFKEAQTVSDQISSEINLALKAGDGYSRIFFLPEKLSNSVDYSIVVENYLVIVSWDTKSAQSTILTKNVAGEFFKGRNLIRNSGGIVYVNQ